MAVNGLYARGVFAASNMGTEGLYARGIFGAGAGLPSSGADASDRHVRQSGVLMHLIRAMRVIVFFLPGVF